MEYILQLNTGSFAHANIDSYAAVKTIQKLIDNIPVKAVIWGWAADYKINSSISELLGYKKIESYLWLPVFSEVMDSLHSDAFITVDGSEKSAINLNRDESFEFVCPSSEKNIRNAIDMFQKIKKDINITGVFLDRIRYPSVANSFSSFVGCSCSSCTEKFKNMGLDLQRIQTHICSEKRKLDPWKFEKGVYCYRDKYIDELSRGKRSIITEAVEYLCGYFHQAGLKVGLDSFAPALADYVGQDLLSICEAVDFIKPMMYRKTTAPAGIPFEEEAVSYCCGQNFSWSEFWSTSLQDDNAFLSQIEVLKKYIEKVSPGIEINSIPGICSATPDYLRKCIRLADKCGCKSITLSWNVSFMTKEFLEVMSK